jgi:hypothetical protein
VRSTKTPEAELIPRAIRWVWENRIAIGKLCTIVGHGEVKKSLLAADIVATINTGRNWFGDEGGAPAPGNALFLQAEDGFRDTTLPRLQAAGTQVTTKPITTNGPPYFTIVPQIRLPSLTATLKQLETDRFFKTKDLRVLLIDPFNAYDEGRGHHHMGSVLQYLCDIATEKRIAIVLIHHFNKAIHRSVDAMIYGSSMFKTKSEIMLAVQTDPDDPNRSIVTGHKGKLTARRAGGLIYGVATRDVPVEGGTTECFPVIEWLGNDDRTADEIASELFEQTRETAKAAKERRSGKRQKAIAFLQDLMAPGVTIETRTIETRAREAGILGEKSRIDNCLVLKSVADELGIRREYGKWTFPDAPAPAATMPEAGVPSTSFLPLLPPPSESTLPAINNKSAAEAARDAAVQRAIESSAKRDAARSPVADDELRKLEQNFNPGT